MNRRTIKEFYENLIDDLENEEIREKLLDDLEEIDDLLLLLEQNIEDELENQESFPSPNEMWDDYESSRKEIVGVWVLWKALLEIFIKALLVL